MAARNCSHNWREVTSPRASRADNCVALWRITRSLLQHGRHPEERSSFRRGVGQRGFDGKRLARLILSEDVLHRQGVSKRLDAIGGHFTQLGHVADDGV